MAAKRLEAGGNKQTPDEKPTAAVMRGYDETLNCAALRKIAAEQDAMAAENEQISGTATSELTVKLGEALQKKFEDGMKTKDFFAQLDRNGDGKISKMEWRQCLRDLGVTGAGSAFGVNDGSRCVLLMLQRHVL